MEKVKYILIFTLLLVIGLLYLELQTYKETTNILLQENHQLEATQNKKIDNIKKLEEENRYILLKISDLNNSNIEKSDKIINLEENLSKMMIKNINCIKSEFIQPQQNSIVQVPKFEDNNSNEVDILITPNLIIDEKKEISGFELQYEQSF